MPTWFGPTTTGVAWRGSSPPAAALFRHYGTAVEGVNYYILPDGSVTTQDQLDPSLVARTLFGAHCEPLTAAEVTVLTNAGLGAYIHDSEYFDHYDDRYLDFEGC